MDLDGYLLSFVFNCDPSAPIEFLPSILAMPGVIAMIGVIYQILRDQAAHENKLEQQQHKLFFRYWSYITYG